MTPDDRTLEPGDVVQIDPGHDERFGACLLVVTEVKSWGVQGYVKVPAGGRAYYRVEYGAIECVGKAPWLARDDVEGDSDG